MQNIGTQQNLEPLLAATMFKVKEEYEFVSRYLLVMKLFVKTWVDKLSDSDCSFLIIDVWLNTNIMWHYTVQTCKFVQFRVGVKTQR